MKQITSILLLTSFMAFQYGRQVSYWECRLSNTFNTSIEKCDCEQLLVDTASRDETLPSPMHHKHLHLDEAFYPSFMGALKRSFLLQVVPTGVTLPIFIDLMLSSRLERPPQPVGTYPENAAAVRFPDHTGIFFAAA